MSAKTPILSFPKSIFQLFPIITLLILDQLTCSLPKNVTTFYGQQDGIIHFCLSPYKMSIFDTMNLYFDLIFQHHPIIASLIFDQLACSLPKSNNTFHQLFKYVKKYAIFHQLDEKIAKTFLAHFYHP